MEDGHTEEGAAARLRREFDRAFALPPGESAVEHANLLAIRVAGDPFALRLGELTGLLKDQKIVATPGAIPQFLGVFGHRGGIIPVYGLREFLKYPPGESPRWVALARSPDGDPIGFAFDEYERHLNVPVTQVISREEAADPEELTPDAIQSGTTIRPILSVPAMIRDAYRWARSKIQTMEA
jgi:chemotaxis signal transduction protein